MPELIERMLVAAGTKGTDTVVGDIQTEVEVDRPEPCNTLSVRCPP